MKTLEVPAHIFTVFIYSPCKWIIQKLLDHAAYIGKKKKFTHLYNPMGQGHSKDSGLDGRIIFK